MYKLIRIALLTITFMYADDIKVRDVEAEYSAEPTVKSVKNLKQSLNLGFANTTGNTDTLNLNGKYTMAFSTQGYDSHELKVGFDMSAFITENNNIKDNEEYTATLGLEQYITDEWLGYTTFKWLRNTFRNFDNKFFVGAGMGKEFFNDGQQSLKIKIGIAYNIEQYTNTQADHDFTSVTEYIEYNNHLNKTSLLYLKIGASENLKDLGDYEILAVCGFNFSIAESLNTCKVKYESSNIKVKLSAYTANHVKP